MWSCAGKWFSFEQVRPTTADIIYPAICLVDHEISARHVQELHKPPPRYLPCVDLYVECIFRAMFAGLMVRGFGPDARMSRSFPVMQPNIADRSSKAERQLLENQPNADFELLPLPTTTIPRHNAAGYHLRSGAAPSQKYHEIKPKAGLCLVWYLCQKLIAINMELSLVA